MALRRRSYGHHHRPDWEQRLCRVDAALADGDLSPAEARDRYRTIGLGRADDQADQLRLDIADAGPDVDEPPPMR